VSRSGLLLRILRCDATAGNSRWSAAGLLSSSSCGSARLLHLNSSQVCLLYTVLLLIVVADPGSGAFFDPWIRDLDRYRIRDEQPEPYFRELRNNIFGLQYFYSLMRIRDPGWKKFGFGIRDKHPGSATLLPIIQILVLS
jgi:hypothetical protein